MNSGIISKDEKLKQKKCKVELKKLKSDYFLIKIFDIMIKKKSLKIIKYNKKMQKRLNLRISDYKKYSQLYSSIEIEIKLDDNKHNENDNFINLSDKQEYFHIYFENSNREIKRNYLKKKIKLIQ